ncbi:hypothetical protein [Burkholderia sp. PAMC 28687]|nr:hypothetical protein [Burkholderia sp. PAMC 28687]
MRRRVPGLAHDSAIAQENLGSQTKFLTRVEKKYRADEFGTNY